MLRQSFALVKHHVEVMQIIIENNPFNRRFVAGGDCEYLFDQYCPASFHSVY
jgi:hypothetical protein